MKKVLIIKLGYSETIDSEIGRISSLGDVLRTTVILHAFKDDNVTWLVDEKAYPLLENNPYIKRILIYDTTSVLQLQSERFDTVINLEKVPGICALADLVKAWRRYGFRFDEIKGEAEAYDNCSNIFSLCKNLNDKRLLKDSWQETLLKLVNTIWEGQEYILGYQPKTINNYFNVGLNWEVGNKWPNKSWSISNWNSLIEMMTENTDFPYTYSKQEGLNSIYEYIDWINSCKLIVTNDSLGLHIALALRKQVIVLYGPTNPNETYFYNRATVLYPEINYTNSNKVYTCIPCLSPKCTQEINCMNFIKPETVMKAINDRLL